MLDIAIRYWEKARAAGLPVPAEFDAFYRDFEWMGVQRHLKVAGIFARLFHRDGKDKYRAEIPRFIKYLKRYLPSLSGTGAVLSVAAAIGGQG